MTKIAIIVGSTRPGRFAPKAAEWFKSVADEVGDAEFSIVDLAEVNLPFLDESKPPMMGDYQNEHTKAWAQTIAGFDGFVFVAQEYNHGYSAALKNALDFLYAEWNHKPVAFVSYGAGAGGSRAVEQLRQVVINLRMIPLNDHVSFVNYWSQMSEAGFEANEQQTALAKDLAKNVAFWSEKLTPIREELETKA
jgi:NAD(P)H-dependent FMN reductase